MRDVKELKHCPHACLPPCPYTRDRLPLIEELQAEVELLRHDLLGGDVALTLAYDSQEAKIKRLRKALTDLVEEAEEQPGRTTPAVEHGRAVIDAKP